MNKSAKFKSDLLKTNEDIAPQSREILQTSVWWGQKLANPPPPPLPQYRRLLIFAALRSYIFARLRRITFNFGKFTNFKALFPLVSRDFP